MNKGGKQMWVRLSACKELLDLKGIHSMSLRVTGKQPQARIMHADGMCFTQKFKGATDAQNTWLKFFI